MSITTKTITEYTAEEMKKALHLYPAEEWAHPFRGLKYTDAKAKFGSANTRGIITISRVFIYTTEYAHLRNTIKHEIAHLIAGVRNHHNNTWRHIAKDLGCTGDRTSTPKNQLATNMKRKWQLVGHLEDGRTIPFQQSHTKQSKWLAYSADHTTPKQECYTFEGKKVLKFNYKENK